MELGELEKAGSVSTHYVSEGLPVATSMSGFSFGVKMIYNWFIMEISLGIIFGLLTMLGYGISNAMVKVVVQKIGPVRTTFFRNTLVSVILFVVMLFYISQTDFNLWFIVIAISISFLGYIPLITFYKALNVGKVGVIAPIANSSFIITVILSVVFFSEKLQSLQIAAIVFVLIGIILISIDFKELKNSGVKKLAAGVPLAMLTCILWGLVFFLLKIPVNVIGPVLTSLILEVGIMIWSGLHLGVKKERLRMPDKKTLLMVSGVAIFTALGTLCYNLGIEIASVSIVVALGFSSPLVATIYGRLVYKEKLGMIQYLGILVVLFGVVAISIG